MGANTLFCFAFYTENTGSTKKSYELDLLRTQLFLGASIFGCEAWRGYSDVETWMNPNMFIQTWKAIKDEGVWAGKDWTIKVDVDAVFLPIRLRQYIGKLEVTENGIYLENCKWVNYG